MEQVRWAVFGPGQIGEFFASALPRSQRGVLHAVASTNSARAVDFAARHGASIVGDYEEILARDDIDAVYVATVHTTHADIAVAALEAGKAVLCEKPVAPTRAEVERVLEAAERTQRPLIEAYKPRFSPFARALEGTVRELGSPLTATAACGFAAGSRTGRLFDPALAGGAILDVGGYPVSHIVQLADAAGINIAELRVAQATGVVGATGVDESAQAIITAGGFTASVATSIVVELSPAARWEAAGGTIEMPNPLGERLESSSAFSVTASDGSVEQVEVLTVDPFAAEADALALALAEGRVEAPEMPWAQSAAISRLLAEWGTVSLTVFPAVFI